MSGIQSSSKEMLICGLSDLNFEIVQEKGGGVLTLSLTLLLPITNLHFFSSFHCCGQFWSEEVFWGYCYGIQELF